MLGEKKGDSDGAAVLGLCLLETDFMLRLGLGRIMRPSKTPRKAFGAAYVNLKCFGDGA